jgi:hypothetical protein
MRCSENSLAHPRARFVFPLKNTAADLGFPKSAVSAAPCADYRQCPSTHT